MATLVQRKTFFRAFQSFHGPILYVAFTHSSVAAVLLSLGTAFFGLNPA